MLWKEIEKEIDKLDLDKQKVKIFADGIAQGKELMALRSDQPGTTMRIIRNLVAHGAILIGVEDPRLIREQAALLRLGNACENNSPTVGQLEGFDYYDRMVGLVSEIMNCVKKRDKVIAKGVDNNIRQGETGILFLGYQHDITAYLAKDIKVEGLSPETMLLHDQIVRDHFANGSFEESIERFTRLRDSFAPQGRGPEKK